jgi:hypothetical protein
VRGSKSFTYYAIPNEPGDFNLGDYVSLVYFDPYEEKYDTLKSRYQDLQPQVRAKKTSPFPLMTWVLFTT